MSGKSCWVCFASGVAVSAAVGVGFGYAWSQYSRVKTMSTVHEPLLAAVAHMRHWAETEDRARLAQYLERLGNCWNAYASGHGETPESFVPRLDQSATPCVAADDRSGE
jgi:hypothetical protein